MEFRNIKKVDRKSILKKFGSDIAQDTKHQSKLYGLIRKCSKYQKFWNLGTCGNVFNEPLNLNEMRQCGLISCGDADDDAILYHIVHLSMA